MNNISSISFGRKIPLTQCQVKNTKTGGFEPATVSELDCQDESDFLMIRGLKKGWDFRDCIADDMEKKHIITTCYGGETDNFFYVIEDKDGEVISISEIEEAEEKVYDVKYIASDPARKYKYAGQSLLAGIGEAILSKKGEAFTVSIPAEDTYEFYVDKCGFEETDVDFYSMDRQQIIDFIDRTETKTQTNYINLRA